MLLKGTFNVVDRDVFVCWREFCGIFGGAIGCGGFFPQVIKLEEDDHVCFWEADGLRFGDVVTAVASLFLLAVLFSYPLEVVLIPVLGLYVGPLVGASVSVFLGGLIVGFVFSGRMKDGWKEAVAKISVLFTVLMVFSIVLNNAVLGEDFGRWVHESYQESNPGASLTAFEWFLVGGVFIGSQMFMNVIVLFVLSLGGLFVGSMLRKNGKSGI